MTSNVVDLATIDFSNLSATQIAQLKEELRNARENVVPHWPGYTEFYDCRQTSKESLDEWRTRVHYLYAQLNSPNENPDFLLKSRLILGLYSSKLSSLFSKYLESEIEEVFVYSILCAIVDQNSPAESYDEQVFGVDYNHNYDQNNDRQCDQSYDRHYDETHDTHHYEIPNSRYDEHHSDKPPNCGLQCKDENQICSNTEDKNAQCLNTSSDERIKNTHYESKHDQISEDSHNSKCIGVNKAYAEDEHPTKDCDLTDTNHQHHSTYPDNGETHEHEQLMETTIYTDNSETHEHQQLIETTICNDNNKTHEHQQLMETPIHTDNSETNEHQRFMESPLLVETTTCKTESNYRKFASNPKRLRRKKSRWKFRLDSITANKATRCKGIVTSPIYTRNRQHQKIPLHLLVRPPEV